MQNMSDSTIIYLFFSNKLDLTSLHKEDLKLCKKLNMIPARNKI